MVNSTTPFPSGRARYDHNEAAAKLQRVGVPAAPVLANWEMVSNPHFHARNFYIPMEHPEMGVFPYPGMPWKLSETPGVCESRVTAVWRAQLRCLPRAAQA